jgi:preprotein translocase subunit SecA
MTLAEDLLDGLVETHAPAEADLEEWDLDALRRDVESTFGVDLADVDFADRTADEIRDAIWERVQADYSAKEQLIGREILQRVERDVMLQVVDTQWKDHLYSLDHLKEGIGLRGYGQRDPLVEYKKESFALFQSMKERVDEETVRFLWWLRPVLGEDASGMPTRRPAPRRPPLVLNDPGGANPIFGTPRAPEPFPGIAARPSGRAAQPPRVGGDDATPKTVRRDEPKVGRNDPCPCGSGRKYKKCHGAAA